MAFLDVASTDSLFSWEDESGTTQTLDVDVVMAAADKRTAKVTDHVVETGVVISDHVVIQPESLSMELLVTQTPFTGTQVSIGIDAPSSKLVSKNYPLDVRPSEFVPGGFFLLTQGVQAVVASVANALLGAAGAGTQMKGSERQETSAKLTAQVIQGDNADRVADVHDKLIEILNGAMPVTVSFKGRLYVDYLLEEVELTHAAGKFGAGTFKVKARALNTVDAATAALPDPADFRAKAAVPKGNKPSTTPDPDPKKSMKSALAHTADGDVTKGLKSLVGLGGG
jgi:hypothetical protein